MELNNDSKDQFLAYISLKIKEKREELGMTQEELAERVNLTRTSITNIERGKTQVQLSTLFEIAKVFGVKLDYFILKDLLSSSKKYVDVDYSPYFNSEIDKSEVDYISNLIDSI